MAPPSISIFLTGAVPPVVLFWYSLVMLTLFAAVILWQRRYGRMWKQFRTKDWEQVAGKFDDGDIVAMRAGRTGRGRVTGYQVWFGYYY